MAELLSAMYCNKIRGRVGLGFKGRGMVKGRVKGRVRGRGKVSVR